MLTDLGADVIKIEPLAGDPARRAAFRNFSAANRGKRAIALDLKNPAALRIARSVVETADVVTSNFRPGVAARLGIDPPSLHAIRPGLVVLESPAYGAQGPLFDRAGFDMVMQALCGHEYRGGGVGNEPLWNRTAMVDTAAGALGAIAVVAGLYHRARTGDGVFIESALVSAGIYLLSELIQRPGGEFAGGEPMNSSRTGYRPTEALYQTRDGWIAVAARGDDAPKRLAEALGLEQTLRGPAARWQADEHAAIAAVLAGRTTAQTLEQLTRAEVWVEECRDGQEAEVLQDAQLLALGTVRSSRHPTHGEIRELGALMRFSRSRTGNGRPAPLLGESTSELLRELGFDEARIAELRARHVVN
jgi:crotonobetainyl-CoA:carnitine CoA-transferase CaiB-like acyl-CoA transferase